MDFLSRHVKTMMYDKNVYDMEYRNGITANTIRVIPDTTEQTWQETEYYFETC